MTRPKVNFRIPDLQAYYKVRTDLTHYRFDSQVMEDLIRLNLRYLDEDRRLNRYRLFQQTASFIWEYKPSAAGPFARSIRIFRNRRIPPSSKGASSCFSA